MDSIINAAFGVFLLIFVGIPAIIIGFKQDKKRLQKNPNTKPYKWGYFIGWSQAVGSTLMLLCCISTPFWLEMNPDDYNELLLLFCYLVFLCLIPGILIIKRHRWARWAWIAHTIALLNPISIIINGIYLKNRWKELGTTLTEKPAMRNAKIGNNKAIRQPTAIDWFKKGLKFTKSGSYQDAINAYNNSINLDPNYLLAYYHRGLVYYKLGNHEQTTNNLKIAAKLGHEKSQELLKSRGVRW